MGSKIVFTCDASYLNTDFLRKQCHLLASVAVEYLAWQLSSPYHVGNECKAGRITLFVIY